MKILTLDNLIKVILLGGLLFMFNRSCNKPLDSNQGGSDTTITYYDTLIIGVSDTIPFYDTQFVIIEKPHSGTVKENGDSLFLTIIKDSLIEGSIVSTVKGSLLSTEFTYKPLFPKYIHRVDTLRIEETIEINNTIVKREFAVGAGTTLNGSVIYGPRILYKDKKRNIFVYGLNISPENKGVIHQISYFKQIGK